MNIVQESPPADEESAPTSRDELHLTTAYVAPRTDAETGLADIWRQVFDVDRVGVEDDFFDLMGDSVHAVVIMSEIDRVFGRLFASSVLLEYPTIGALAKVVAGADTGASSSVLFPFRTEGSKSPLFLVHGRLGHAFLNPVFSEALDPDRPAYCFQARGLNGRDPPHNSIEAMVEDYIGAMQALQPQGPYVLGSLCGGSHVAVAMAGSLRRRGEELLPLVLIDPPVVTPAREGRVDWSVSAARFRRTLRRMSADGVFVGRNGRGYFGRIYRHFFSRGSRRWSTGNTGPEDRRDGRASQSWERLGVGRIAGSGPDGPPSIETASETSFLFMNALREYDPLPFDGEIDAILSEDRAIWAEDPNYYLRSLSKELRVHVVGRDHKNLFREHLSEVAKKINDVLRDAP